MTLKIPSTIIILALALFMTTMTLPSVAAHTAPWQTRGTYWAPAPGGDDGFAQRLETVPADDATPVMADHGSISFSPAEGTAVEDLAALSVDLYLEAGECGTGSPRFVVRVDTDGDGRTDESVLAYPAEALGAGCPLGTWITLDLLNDADARWVVPGLGQVDADTARAHYDSDHAGNQVVRVDLQWDNTVSHGPATVYFDDIVIHEHTLSEPTDGELICPATVEPGFGPCPFRIA